MALTVGPGRILVKTGEILRALREGEHRDGRAPLLMPSDQYRVTSDSDALAIVAYLRELPPVPRTRPATHLGALGMALFGVGVLPSSVQEPLRAPVPGPRAEVSRSTGSTSCASAAVRHATEASCAAGTAGSRRKAPI